MAAITGRFMPIQGCRQQAVARAEHGVELAGSAIARAAVQRPARRLATGVQRASVAIWTGSPAIYPPGLAYVNAKPRPASPGATPGYGAARTAFAAAAIRLAWVSADRASFCERPRTP